MEHLNVDILILGGGMSGLATASFAAQAGAKVLVCEKLATIGGSSAYSAGMFWAPKHYADIRRWIPGGDPILQKSFHADYLRAVEWMRQSGVPTAPRFEPIMSIGIGYPVKLQNLYEFHQSRISDSNTGSEIWLSATAASLEQELPGVRGSRVTGAIIQKRDNESGDLHNIHVTAAFTVLATGGFQGSSQLTSEHFGPGGDDIFVRSNPGSVGDGLILATGAGAGTSTGLSTYYGHLMASPLFARDVKGSDYIPLAQYQSKYCMLVNSQGLRFTDETLGDEIINQDLAKQEGRKGFLLFNEKTRKKHCVTAMFPNAGAIDRLAKAREYGCRVVTAPTIDELVKQVAAWGCNSSQLTSTIEKYRERVSNNDTRVILDAPVGQGPSSPPEPLCANQGPYYAMEVQPSVTFTYGGVRIDDQGQALTPSGIPIPGLLVSGVDGGGFSNVAYCGGLSLAFVTGWWAARTATAALGLEIENLPDASPMDLSASAREVHL